MRSEDLSGAPVDFELLEFDDDFALLDGVPFTGIVQSQFPDGALEYSGRYRDGLPEGLNESWYPNGQIFNRWIAIRGAGSSETWTWYPDGTPRSYRRYGASGFPIELRSWDANGGAIDPVSQPSANRADVLADLFERAVGLKLGFTQDGATDAESGDSS